MRIGILTYHNAINYGAILQVFALQQTLKKIDKNIEVYIINYCSKTVEKQYNWIKYKESTSLKKYILSNATVLVRKKKKENFKEFLKNNLNCTKKIITLKDNLIQEFDILIVGSDQVWNPDCTDGDGTYLLENVGKNILKVSYAASMGNENKISLYQDKYGIDYLKKLQDFDFISCREMAATNYLIKKLEKKCETVVDPVVLCDIKEWRQLIESMKKSFNEIIRDKYVFIYNLGNFEILSKIVKKIRKETNYKILVVNKDIKGDLIFYNCENRSNIGPDEFLYLLSNAELVISDSFHATAFSIIFKRKFYVIGNNSPNNTNTRMQNILKHYKLEERYLIGTTKIESLNLKQEIDYSISEDIMKKDKEFAKQWLINIITTQKN